MTTNRRTNTTTEEPIRAGVIGVGSMGQNHARVYGELPTVDLVGVTDRDDEIARTVAREHGTEPVRLEALLDRCDLVTVAVPTGAHYETVSTCLDAGVHVLVEKPIAGTVEEGQQLAEQAREAGLVLQVGHIERFNPAVRTVADLIDDLDVIGVEAERLGPPVDRAAPGNVIYDLMVHDVDIVGSILDAKPRSIAAMGTDDGQYATATIEYGDVVATVTASRVTQKKVRKLTVTARDCLLEVDYLEQSVLIHRDSYPEYLSGDGQPRYRHESVVERPHVDTGEPLRYELEAFVSAVRAGSEPVVTAEDGIQALETVQLIDRLATGPTDDTEDDPSREREVEA
ncbi:Gfo/Idh/MocA family protein [Natrinema salsiterrestre]|uniref:Gfo/Idh/MocA family oxidoreductase n=1 Tax=Natrinema salsiterrestre TaxID=2950540 RepID=A0A9Q4Q3C9_9EURY|nr:Gfo/Idh/MocA family oxidoreductase [Natrinema salsiterrestre]MDF9745997.1 Gfo/Idh/MocA family oxidoreductase [Natrinema salsiterrestre]